MTLTPEFIAIGRMLAFVVCAWFASGLGMACALPTGILVDQWCTRQGKDTLSGRARMVGGMDAHPTGIGAVGRRSWIMHSSWAAGLS